MSVSSILWIFLISVIFINSVSSCQGYTCETTMESIILPNTDETDTTGDNETDSKLAYKFFEARKWPEGEVPYKLHETLTATDKSQFQLAVQEYDAKTCIRFRPWISGDLKFVSVERSEEIKNCGQSQYCVLQNNSESGGYQYLRIKGDCGYKETFVHEMGHVLCIGHEHERPDRDQYISYDNCNSTNTPKKRKNAIFGGIYDYASQMHYDCKGSNINDDDDDSSRCEFPTPKEKEWTQCGPQLHNGLSVIDADSINALYDCQGCRRHRWIPARELTSRDYENLYNFGHVDELKRPLYPCRVSYEGRVQVGMYTREEGKCKIASRCEKRNLEIKNEIEVLTIPNGLNSGRFEYKLIDLLNDDKSTEDLINIGVPAGMGLYEAGGGRLVNSYISYFNLTREQYFDSEDDDESVTHDSFNNVMGVISSVWEFKKNFGYIGNVRGISPKFLNKISVLVCEEG